MRLDHAGQGIQTVQGKSEMLPLYQDKKKQFFATLKTKFKNNKKTFLKNKSNKKATGYFGSFFIFLFCSFWNIFIFIFLQIKTFFYNIRVEQHKRF